MCRASWPGGAWAKRGDTDASDRVGSTGPSEERDRRSRRSRGTGAWAGGAAVEVVVVVVAVAVAVAEVEAEEEEEVEAGTGAGAEAEAEPVSSDGRADAVAGAGLAVEAGAGVAAGGEAIALKAATRAASDSATLPVLGAGTCNQNACFTSPLSEDATGSPFVSGQDSAIAAASGDKVRTTTRAPPLEPSRSSREASPRGMVTWKATSSAGRVAHLMVTEGASSAEGTRVIERSPRLESGVATPSVIERDRVSGLPQECAILVLQDALDVPETWIKPARNS